jgi:three-Cys-motif partner protein
LSDCVHGGETKANGNCTVPAPDDGLPVQCVGYWAQDKHYYIQRYIEATREVRARFLPPVGKGGAAFVDLFAGPGRCRIRDTGRIVNGSPLLALASDQAPFTKLVFSDFDAENINALRRRTAFAGSRVEILHGDANAMVDAIVDRIPAYGLNVAFLDPFGADALKFETVAKLAAVKRMDLIIHYPTGDLKRNIARDPGRARAFVGGDSGEGLSSPSEVAAGIEALKSNLTTHGYTGKAVRSVPIKNNKGVILYHLVFASKHLRGNSIWNSIVRRESRGQGNLF